MKKFRSKKIRSTKVRSKRNINNLTRMIISLIMIAGMIMGLSSGLNASAANVSAKGEDEIQSLIDEFSRNTKCNSVSVMVYDHGEISYYGDKDGLYQIGSMTKSFTGLAIQKLIDEGKLSAEDKLSDYIKYFEAYYNSEKVEITIGQLLTQTSGFTNSESDYYIIGDISLTDWAYNFSGRELKCAPGTEYNYSNVNFALLGAVIESVTGSEYKSFMETKVLDPIGLHNTYVGEPDNKGVIEGSRLAYRKTVDYEIPISEATIPAGYFYSNIEDMGQWMNLWISQDTDMETDLDTNQDTDTNQDSNLNIALAKASANVVSCLKNEGDYYAGWERFEDGAIGHSGGTANYSSRIVFSKDKQTGVCVLTNLNVAASTDSLCNNIFKSLNGESVGTIAVDVWTIFDIVFTVVSIVMILLGILVIGIRRRKAAIGIGVVVLILLILIEVLFPTIFSATLSDILGTWAPWSMTTAIILMVVDIIICLIAAVLCKPKRDRNANNYQRGEGPASYSYN